MRLAVILALALLAGCATPERLGAAHDARALLVAIRDGDQAQFDAHVDRGALEAALQAKLVARTRRSALPGTVRGVGVLISGPLARVAVNGLARPEVLRGVADYYGYRPGQPLPGTLAIAAALKAAPGGRVCAVERRAGPCLITFADEGGTWKLVDFDLDRALRLADQGPAR